MTRHDVIREATLLVSKKDRWRYEGASLDAVLANQVIELLDVVIRRLECERTDASRLVTRRDEALLHVKNAYECMALLRLENP